MYMLALHYETRRTEPATAAIPSPYTLDPPGAHPQKRDTNPHVGPTTPRSRTVHVTSTAHASPANKPPNGLHEHEQRTPHQTPAAENAASQKGARVAAVVHSLARAVAGANWANDGTDRGRASRRESRIVRRSATALAEARRTSAALRDE